MSFPKKVTFASSDPIIFVYTQTDCIHMNNWIQEAVDRYRFKRFINEICKDKLEIMILKKLQDVETRRV
jgi:hypothetical protein